MAEDNNDKQTEYADDEQEGTIFRWMSAFVVLLAVAGFFGLAWYAYKSGGDAVDEKDVELVKADTAPVKEAPANPGGMQIPNQDKTVYGLVNGGKGEKPTVERILPAPEEPVERDGGTQTWMSDKTKSKVSGDEAAPQKVADTTPAAVPATTPAVLPPAATPVQEAAPKEVPVADKKPVEQFNPSAHTADAASTPKAPVETMAAAKPIAAAPIVIPTPPAVTVPAKKATPAVQKPVAEKKAPEKKAAAATSGIKVARAQLGAFKSDADAQATWSKLTKKFSDETKGKEHYVVRADLGDKGVFYRLQMGPFDSVEGAEEACVNFVSAGQGCIATKAK